MIIFFVLILNNYCISELLTQLKLGNIRRVSYVYIIYTNINFEILKVLYNTGLILGYSLVDSNKKFKVFLKYVRTRSVYRNIKLVSKPTKRVYWSKKVILNNLNKSDFFGFYIISTKKGLITNFSYLYDKIDFGGEVLLKILF